MSQSGHIFSDLVPINNGSMEFVSQVGEFAAKRGYKNIQFGLSDNKQYLTVQCEDVDVLYNVLLRLWGERPSLNQHSVVKSFPGKDKSHVENWQSAASAFLDSRGVLYTTKASSDHTRLQYYFHCLSDKYLFMREAQSNGLIDNAAAAMPPRPSAPTLPALVKKHETVN